MEEKEIPHPQFNVGDVVIYETSEDNICISSITGMFYFRNGWFCDLSVGDDGYQPVKESLLKEYNPNLPLQ